MDKRIKKLWVDALRSGDYKQGKNRLRSHINNEFCCLGVLCNLHAIEHPKVAALETRAYWYMNEYEFLPDAVVRWAGLPSRDGEITPHTSLATLNDLGAPFHKIADAIEKHF